MTLSELLSNLQAATYLGYGRSGLLFCILKITMRFGLLDEVAVPVRAL